jgi:hypothetical protein
MATGVGRAQEGIDKTGWCSECRHENLRTDLATFLTERGTELKGTQRMLRWSDTKRCSSGTRTLAGRRKRHRRTSLGACFRKKRLRVQQKRPSGKGARNLERETGFEPATSTLARSHSTAELLPLSPLILQQFHFCAKFTAPRNTRNLRRERFQAPRCAAPVHLVRLSARGHAHHHVSLAPAQHPCDDLRRCSILRTPSRQPVPQVVESETLDGSVVAVFQPSRTSSTPAIAAGRT